MHIYCAGDHRGYDLSKKIYTYLVSNGYEATLVGPTENNPDDDYPDVTTTVIDAMNHDIDARGIILCGSGVGVSIAANRFSHIRCVLGHSAEQVRAARTDDDCNVLALGADFTPQQQAFELISVFLNTKFNEVERYKRRISKLSQL